MLGKDKYFVSTDAGGERQQWFALIREPAGGLDEEATAEHPDPKRRRLNREFAAAGEGDANGMAHLPRPIAVTADRRERPTSQGEDGDAVVAHIGDEDTPEAAAQPTGVVKVAWAVAEAAKSEAEDARGVVARDAMSALIGDVYAPPRASSNSIWVAQLGRARCDAARSLRLCSRSSCARVACAEFAWFHYRHRRRAHSRGPTVW